jgi:hypothetical protein
MGEIVAIGMIGGIMLAFALIVAFCVRLIE